jgi:hypothetical protein
MCIQQIYILHIAYVYIYTLVVVVVVLVALGPVWAGTRAQSGDWYGSGTLHPGQVLRGGLPFLSPVGNYLTQNTLSQHSRNKKFF